MQKWLYNREKNLQLFIIVKNVFELSICEIDILCEQ
jgi:hypothetical protein